MASDEVVQPETKEPIGQTLKRAREQRGLTETDVANAQHLRTGVIQAIEAGEYSKVDSEIFLKGYVRAYARMVGLNADEIIAGLDEELEPMRVAEKQAVEANPLVSIERRREQKRRVARGVFYTALVGLAGYLAFTFVLPKTDFELPGNLFTTSSIEESEPTGVSDSGATVETEEPASSAPSPDAERQQPDTAAGLEEPAVDGATVFAPDTSSLAEEDSTAVVEEDVPTLGESPSPDVAESADDEALEEQGIEEGRADAESSSDVSGAQEPLASGQSQVQLTADEQPESDVQSADQAPVFADEAGVQDEPVAGDSISEAPTTDNSGDAVEAGPTATQEAPEASTANLDISFVGDCWVQVTDASGNRLASSLQRSGDRLQVAGEAPLRVVIGAVDAVSAIQFEGRPVDLDGFRIVNNRSEFTLPQ
ncbi:RodZ domain-containing protein [Marinobacter sp. F4216]|uniref:RodZ domain-containing protein n=1 Tax=Marinobacter sp. F4216 TaxID=2874281 RepID=UPI001CBD13B4|nr:RodZ domain-containing protein [Marinobacter sp. F4216]MBZ2170024.1 DUF4115 domain-containing protein [Marinobacter sp. F4216]